jgi:hypothetical protein
MNIVQMILNLFSGDLFAKLGGMLGLSSERTASTVKAAVPALLGSLASQASTPEGARKIANAVRDADDSILGNPGNFLDQIGRSGPDAASSLLGSLLPSNMLSGLTGALSKFSGIGSSMITPLLGSLAPMVLGFLKKQTKAAGSDAASITQLFADQRENITSALPSGLANMLSDVPGLGSLTGAASRAVAGTVQPVMNTGKAAADYVGTSARRASNTISPWLWILPLLALLALGWWAFSNWFPRGDREPAVAQRQTDDAQDPQRVVVKRAPVESDDAVTVAPSLGRTTEITKGVNDVFTSLTDTIGEIKDVESAKAALPRLRKVATQLDELKEPITALPDTQRSLVSKVIGSGLDKLRPLIESLYAIPGVRAILSPVIDPLLARIDEYGTVTRTK